MAALQVVNNDSSRVPIGILLQELAVTGAETKIKHDSGNIVRFETTLQDTKPNRNKRWYRGSTLKETIGAPSVQEKLKTRTFWGEANHPFDPSVARQMVVDNLRVSHLVYEISTDGDVVRGSVETASTAAGRDKRGLIVDNGATMAYSMRGIGNVKKIPGKDILEVVSPLALIAYDWVTFPSHSDAYQDRSTLRVNEHTALLYAPEAQQFVMDQSRNVRAILEQFELADVECSITEDAAAAIIKSEQAIVKIFLERDVREEFRLAMLHN